MYRTCSKCKAQIKEFEYIRDAKIFCGMSCLIKYEREKRKAVVSDV